MNAFIATNEDICSSVIITRRVCYSACAEVLCFTIWAIDGSEFHVLHGVLWKNSVCSAKKRWRKWNEKRKTDRDLYDVEVSEVDTTRKLLKIQFVGFSHEYGYRSFRYKVVSIQVVSVQIEVDSIHTLSWFDPLEVVSIQSEQLANF